jgi:hypothetical protein
MEHSKCTAEPGSKPKFSSEVFGLNSQCCITRNMTLSPLLLVSYQDPGIEDNTHKVCRGHAVHRFSVKQKLKAGSTLGHNVLLPVSTVLSRP